MAIHFDIEEIVGAGCLSGILRGLAAFSCLWLGSAAGILGHGFAEGVVRLLEGVPVDVPQLVSMTLYRMVFGPLTLFASVWIILLLPLVLMVYFTFAKGDGGSLWAWVGWASATGFLVALSFVSWDRYELRVTAITFAMWFGFAGSLALIAYLLAMWEKRRLAQHLLGISAQNEARRYTISEEFGTAVADRQFALGAESTSSSGRPPVGPSTPDPPRAGDPPETDGAA